MDTTKKAVLVVSFGTSHTDSINAAINPIAQLIQEAFPCHAVAQAYTSGMIINKLKKSGIYIDTVAEALNKLLDNGITDLLIQPTHMMDGHEYDKMVAMAGNCQNEFQSVKIGRPLLYSDEDFRFMADFLLNTTGCASHPKTAYVFMGHGTDHPANRVYKKLNQLLIAMGVSNVFIGTVEGEPALEDLFEVISPDSFDIIQLQPLMIVAGDHAKNDMAGDDEDSWKSSFAAKGFQVDCRLKGLGEYKEIQERFLAHLKDLA